MAVLLVPKHVCQQANACLARVVGRGVEILQLGWMRGAIGVAWNLKVVAN
jgi:hypothetical protein